jgi:hypothetical protein
MSTFHLQLVLDFFHPKPTGERTEAALAGVVGWQTAHLGISPAAYGRIEVCGRVETPEQLHRLAQALGVTEAQLRGEGLQGWERPDCRSRQAVALWAR